MWARGDGRQRREGGDLLRLIVVGPTGGWALDDGIKEKGLCKVDREGGSKQ